eukprot:g30539.t1
MQKVMLVWNKLPEEVVEASIVTPFKRHLDGYMNRETDQDEYECQIYSRMGDRFRWEEVVSVQLSVTATVELESKEGKSCIQILQPHRPFCHVSKFLLAYSVTCTSMVETLNHKTNLFKDQLEQGGWSVLISDLRKTDQDEYQCQIYRKTSAGLYWEQTECVHLSVT